MDASDVLEYKLSDRREAELKFEDGSVLKLVPIISEDSGYIIGFDHAALYRNRVLEALVTGEHRPEESRFWSRSGSKVTQKLLLDYLMAASDVGDRCHRDYENEKIGEADWQAWYEEFWIITGVQRLPLSPIVCLNDGKLEVLNNPPEDVIEQI